MSFRIQYCSISDDLRERILKCVRPWGQWSLPGSPQLLVLYMIPFSRQFKREFSLLRSRKTSAINASCPKQAGANPDAASGNRQIVLHWPHCSLRQMFRFIFSWFYWESPFPFANSLLDYITLLLNYPMTECHLLCFFAEGVTSYMWHIWYTEMKRGSIFRTAKR